MRALLFDGRLRYVADRPEPVLLPGEALVRVTLAGICSTDLAITRGYKGWYGVLGHEFTGVVEAVHGAGDRAWVGRRVVGEINIGCGTCARCQARLQNHCPDRAALGIFGRDGAFAEYLALPVANLHPIPDGLPDQQAVFVEPLAAALEVLEQVHLAPSARALVIGDGRLGCLVAQVLALNGADTALLGRHPDRLAWLGARGVRRAESGESFPLVVDCTGSTSGLEETRARVEPRGRIMLKSSLLEPFPLDLGRLMVDEVTLVGSRCGPFAPALRLLAGGKVAVQEMVEQVYPLEEGVAAFAACQGRLKLLLRP